MILVDTVYQRVLALANKEQRGYITPQEFNLFANQAQLEILDSYIYEINQLSRAPGNETEFSDMLSLVDEKLSFFKNDLSVSAGLDQPYPPDFYRFGKLYNQNRVVEQVNQNQYFKYLRSTFTAPSPTNPMCVLKTGTMSIYPTSLGVCTISYVRKPHDVNWGYVVINDKALYDPSQGKTINFELHPSEETELVYKILKLSGAAIQKPNLAQFAQGMEQKLQQQEKQ